jgi:putative methyltransferase (TIGR04325 family)
MKNDTIIWEGVYQSFDDCPKGDKGFSNKKWIKKSIARAKKLLQATERNDVIPSPEIIGYRESLLPFLIALLSANGKRIRVLDFGGGLGFTYLPTISCCERKSSVEYHICETETLYSHGKEIFQKYKNVCYHNKLSDISKNIDVVYLSSSLQYIEDWKDLLAWLSEHNPTYFLFDGLVAGNIPTFATVQKYYDESIPYRFLNLIEVIDQMKSLSYGLLFKSARVEKIFGKEQPIPMQNFPRKYRLRNTCNLLFSKN